MTRYRVSFFKNLRGFDGHTSRCLQQAIVIRRANSVERAVETAKRRVRDETHCRSESSNSASSEYQSEKPVPERTDPGDAECQPDGKIKAAAKRDQGT